MDGVYVSLMEVLQTFLIFSLGMGISRTVLWRTTSCSHVHMETGRNVILREIFKETAKVAVLGIVFVGMINLVKRCDVIEKVLPISVEAILFTASCAVLGVYVLTMLFLMWGHGGSLSAGLLRNIVRNACWAGVLFLVFWLLIVVTCMFI